MYKLLSMETLRYFIMIQRDHLVLLSVCLIGSITLCVADLNMDAVIHFRTKYGDTLLHAAVKSRDSEALSSFLELGCPTEATDKNGKTALWLATEHGEVEMMRILSKYGANMKLRYGQFNESLLHAAAKNGQDLAVFWLLDKGFSTESRDKAGWTPLHSAAVFNHRTTVHLLVARGADVNAMEKHGETPLHKAVRLAREKIVKQLIDLGASVNATDEENHTPLYWAKRFKYGKITELLETKRDPKQESIDEKGSL